MKLIRTTQTTNDVTFTRPRSLSVLLVVGFALLGLAWAGGNPPAASPDEDAHFIKAYATGHGQFRGELSHPDVLSMDRMSMATRQKRWSRMSSRWFRMPARLSPPRHVKCYAFNRERTADCDVNSPLQGNEQVMAASHVGTYHPFPYVVSGSAMRGADDFHSAARRGRFASLAVCMLFIAWAAAVLGRNGVLSLVGLVCATTPMVIFLSASLNTSGLEITAAILFWSASIMLWRAPDHSYRSDWVAFALSGTALALTRPLGAILVTIALTTIAGFAGFTSTLRALNRARLSAAAAIILMTLSCAVSLVWAHFNIPHPPVDVALAAASLGPAIRDLPNQVREIIGIFGWNETTMPLPAYVLGLLPLCGLGALALALGSARERFTLIALGLCIVMLDLVLAVVIEAQIGFGMQARYLLPLIVGLVIMAADIVQRQAERLSPRTLHLAGAVTCAGSALLHGQAFLTNQHRYAVGASGGWLPPWESRWSPEGGLAIWLFVATVGCAALGAAGLLLYRRALRSPAGNSHDETPAIPLDQGNLYVAGREGR